MSSSTSSASHHNKRIIVSLTSIPPRLATLHQIAERLLNQTCFIDKIYFNIPHQYKNERIVIPTSLSEFILRHDLDKRIVINRCKDYGPITKLMATLEKERPTDDFICIMDDDILPEFNAIETLILRCQKGTAVSFSGWNIGKGWSKFQSIINNIKDEEVDWIQGTSLIVMRLNDLDKKVLLNYPEGEIGELFRRNDDHWICYNLELKGIKRVSVGYTPSSFLKNIKCKEYTATSLSGGSNRFKFFKDVYKLAIYLKNQKIYYRSSLRSNSSVYKYITLIVILLIISLITKNYKFLLLSLFSGYELTNYAKV